MCLRHSNGRQSQSSNWCYCSNKASPIYDACFLRSSSSKSRLCEATKHKLNLLVYAGCEIRSCSAYAEPEVSCSGPTYIAVRSGKHQSSTAYTHGHDLRKLIHLKEFVSVVKDNEGFIKPTGVLLCDCRPDENPRFPKTLAAAIQNFKEFNLDALLICTLAPGMSVYKHVERRMAPLSKALSGVLLPYNTCGSHIVLRDERQMLNWKNAISKLLEKSYQKCRAD